MQACEIVKMENCDDGLWSKILSQLEVRLGGGVFAAYIKPLKMGQHDFNSSSPFFELSCPSRLVRNYVESNFTEDIHLLTSELTGIKKIEIRFTVEASQELKKERYVVVKKQASVAYKGLRAEKGNLAGKLTKADAAKIAQESKINAKYTFDNFVVGNNNQFCHAAAMRVADKPGESYNPLFIYGGVGLGKTHLLHAIGNAVLRDNPFARVLYMSSETFTNELISGLRFGKMDEFKKRLRDVQVLLIDDIQFMCGKERTQEEFFHTFNALYSLKHQIVITSDKMPQDIKGLEERLRTRFSWGLAADLQAPDFETRAAILNRKAQLENFSLPRDVSAFIAKNITSNVRELEGALTRLHAMSSLQQRQISLGLAETALAPLFQSRSVKLSIEEVKEVVANHFGIKVSEMISKRRTKNLSFPRHVAMYLCRKHTTASYPEIGSKFGGRDHSSVIHAANVVSTKLGTDEHLRFVIGRIEREFSGIG
jgi:chromosomal replication initiator protein